MKQTYAGSEPLEPVWSIQTFWIS